MDRLAREEGAILDGFPRTLPQAKALDDRLAEEGLQVAVVPLIHVGDEEVISRLTGRRVCRKCGATYHLVFKPPTVDGVCGATYHLVFKPPTVDGVCDACGGELYQRDDDSPETVQFRLYTYYRETGPLIGYYYAKDLLVQVDGEQAIAEVQADLRSAVEAALQARS
jgi:adenylate kinase